MRLFSIALLFFISSLVLAQNLVPNPGFEDTASCPDGLAQIYKSTGWSAYGGSPDFYCGCASTGFVSVPFNIYGFQMASEGNSFCGIATYVKDDFGNYSFYREVIGRQLASPLIIGQKYYVSFKESFTLNNFETDCAANKTGALFSTVPFNNLDSLSSAPLKNYSHIYTDSILSDTSSWMTVSGSFIADSAYNYICIGNFFKNANTDIIDFSKGLYASYYYIDQVCVSTDSLTCFEPIGINTYRLPDFIKMFPNPVSDILHIQIDKPFTEAIKLKMFDQFGELTKEIDLRSSITEIDIKNFARGVYFISFQINDKTIIKKLIII
jgi:hypothetical protein